jgi:hypothetical protein
MCHLRQEVWHDLKRRVIGLHFKAAQAIGEYVEKEGARQDLYSGLMPGPGAARSYPTVRWTRPRYTA